MPGVVIAGTHSGCGKTTVTLGIMAALKKKGLVVQAFKAGPDFIDSGLHRVITGRPSRNLDLWMCGKDYVGSVFSRHSQDADFAVVEGVMGLYDGTLSTASLAARLNLPVVLVVDAYGMAETAGAVVEGLAAHAEEKIEFAGVIFNRVASETHYDRLRASVRGVKALGYLPRDLAFEIPHRHLGLTVAEENPLAGEQVDRLADAVLRHIDVNALMERSSGRKQHYRRAKFGTAARAQTVVAVAYDKAFCFYYEDNLDLLRDEGAKIVCFSPLNDEAIPEGAHAVYIGGGYPELYARDLSMNQPMLGAIRLWAASGKVLYAECGGLMYLSRGIRDFDGKVFGMAGIFPFDTRMKKGRSKLGYREILLREDCVIGSKDAVVRGHEFHYSEIIDGSHVGPEVAEIYSVRNGAGHALREEGYRYKRALAGYVHIHFGSNPAIARTFIGLCGEKGT